MPDDRIARQPPIAGLLLLAPDVHRLVGPCAGHPAGGEALTRDDRRTISVPIRQAARRLAVELERHPLDATLPTAHDRALAVGGWVVEALVHLLKAIELAYAALHCPCQADGQLPAAIADTAARVIGIAEHSSTPDADGPLRQALVDWLDDVVHAFNTLERGLAASLPPRAAGDHLDARLAGDGFVWWLWAPRDFPDALRRPVGRLLQRARRHSSRSPAAEHPPFLDADLMQTALELAA
jgi:hypothetical protein